MTAVSTKDRLALFQDIFDFGGACTIERLTKAQFKLYQNLRFLNKSITTFQIPLPQLN